MNVQLARLGAIIRNEFRMQWRRRTLLVVMVGMVGPALLFSLFGRSILATLTGASSAAIDVERMVVTLTWTPVYGVALMVIPALLADAIPKDRQLGVAEVLGSIPLPTGVYLIGKVLGQWLGALAGMAIVIPLAGLAFRLGVGEYDPGAYLQMWAIGALPLILVNTGLAVLLAAGAPDRRRAILVGITFTLVSISLLLAIRPAEASALLVSLNLARPAPLLYYALFGGQSLLGGTLITVEQVVWSAVAGFAEVALLGGAVWLWLRYQETKQ